MALRATHSKAFGPTSITTTIGVLWDPGSGNRIRLMSGIVSSQTAGTVHITAGTAAAAGTIATIACPANESIPFDVGDGVEKPAAGVELGVKHGIGTSNVTATLRGRIERF